MLSIVVLIGRLAQEPQLKIAENGSEMCFANLAVVRGFKNASGEYDTDFVHVQFFDNVAKNLCTYCKKGDVVCVKGRIQTYVKELPIHESGEGVQKKFNMLTVVCEKLVYMSNKRAPEEPTEDAY